MRLTFINQFYPPDLAPTGRLAASLADHRAAQGDEVTVITGQGAYASASPEAGPGPAGNPRVRRLWTPGLGKGSAARRLADYAWFYLAAAVHLLLLRRQDLIIALTTPPFIAWTAALHRRLHRSTRLILWNMDCYPEALVGAGLVSERSWIARLLRWQNRLLFRQLDCVICLDAAMEQLLRSHYVVERSQVPMAVIPNWEPAARFRRGDSIHQEKAVGPPDLESRLCVLHVGNTGMGHAFETIAQAAERMRNDAVAFVFIGGGARWSRLEAVKRDRELPQWHLLRYLPEDQLLAAMATSGCALITLRDSFLGVISPSKLHAALAVGLPILYIGPEGSNVDEAIRRFGCGVSLRHGDIKGVVEFVHRLAKDGAFAADLRRHARGAFEAAYSDERVLPLFDQALGHHAR